MKLTRRTLFESLRAVGARREAEGDQVSDQVRLDYEPRGRLVSVVDDLRGLATPSPAYSMAGTAVNAAASGQAAVARLFPLGPGGMWVERIDVVQSVALNLTLSLVPAQTALATETSTALFRPFDFQGPEPALGLLWESAMLIGGTDAAVAAPGSGSFQLAGLTTGTRDVFERVFVPLGTALWFSHPVINGSFTLSVLARVQRRYLEGGRE